MMDEGRFRTLYEQTSKPLLMYILRVTGDRALSDDLFQESYVRLLQVNSADVDASKLKAYLFTIATNLIRDHWRRAKKNFHREDVDHVHVSTNRAEEQADLRLGLEGALEGLSLREKSLLWLAYVEGYTHREIAAMLHLREKSVRVLLFRAKRKFSKILDGFGIPKEEML